MDESFAAYTVRGEGSLIELEDVVTHFIVMCNDNSSVSKSTFVTYRKGMTSVVGVGVGGALAPESGEVHIAPSVGMGIENNGLSG